MDKLLTIYFEAQLIYLQIFRLTVSCSAKHMAANAGAGAAKQMRSAKGAIAITKVCITPSDAEE